MTAASTARIATVRPEHVAAVRTALLEDLASRAERVHHHAEGAATPRPLSGEQCAALERDVGRLASALDVIDALGWRGTPSEPVAFALDAETLAEWTADLHARALDTLDDLDTYGDPAAWGSQARSLLAAAHDFEAAIAGRSAHAAAEPANRMRSPQPRAFVKRRMYAAVALTAARWLPQLECGSCEHRWLSQLMNLALRLADRELHVRGSRGVAWQGAQR